MIANLVLLTFSYSICKPCCHHHRWRSIYMFSFCLHCLLHCMQILPLQVSPSSIYPGLQCEHWYEPKVLTHLRSAGQWCFPGTHSSTSTQNLRKKTKAKNSPGWDISSNFMKVVLRICVLFFLFLFLPVLFTSFKSGFFCLFSCLFSVMLHE